MKQLLAVLASLALVANGQDGSYGNYLATASTTALTIQQPAANAKQVVFDKAWVYCVAAQTVTLSWNGTAATATTLATLVLPPYRLPSQATAWSSSNAGGGTTGPVYNVGAGVTFPIDLSKIGLGAIGTGANLTITTSGTCTITVAWSEK